ncbi:MAG: FitA-like ribbon-helix-helix domain-containing protein [Gemmatimonadota bacterium]
MPSFTLKNIPDDLYDALKQRAAANQRSINQEVLFCLRLELARQRRTPADAQRLLEQIDRQRAGA